MVIVSFFLCRVWFVVRLFICFFFRLMRCVVGMLQGGGRKEGRVAGWQGG